MNDIWLCVVTLHMQWQRYVTVLYVIYCGLTETLICRQFQTRSRSETAVSGKIAYLKVPLLYNVGFLSLEIFIVALLSDYFFICIFYEAGSRNPLQNSNLTNQVPHREPVTQNKVCLSLVFHPNCAWMPFSAFPFTLCVLCHRCLWTVPPNHLRVNSSTCEWNTELSFGVPVSDVSRVRSYQHNMLQPWDEKGGGSKTEIGGGKEFKSPFNCVSGSKLDLH